MRHRHPALYRLTARLLLVWLLVLASGLVNACVLTPGSNPRAMAMATIDCAHCPTGEDQPAAGSACAKYCADGAGAVQAAQPAFDAGAALGMAPWPTLALVLATEAAAPIERPALAPPPLARVPARIAFRHLTP